MDITKLPRSSIYKDKISLDYFEVDTEGSMDYVMYNELLKLKTLETAPRKTLKDTYLLFFNDAYYIITSVLFDDRPELNFDYYLKEAGRLSDEVSLSIINDPIKQRCVLSLVCAILDTHFSNRKETRRFIALLKDWINNSNFAKRIYDKLKNNSSLPNNTDFKPCALEQEKLDYINWEQVFDLFDKGGDFLPNECKAVIDKLGKDDKEKLLVVNSMLDFFEKQINENYKNSTK